MDGWICGCLDFVGLHMFMVEERIILVVLSSGVFRFLKKWIIIFFRSLTHDTYLHCEV